MPGKVGLFLHSELLCSEIELQSRGRGRPLQLLPKGVTLFKKKHVEFLAHCIVKKKIEILVESSQEDAHHSTILVTMSKKSRAIRSFTERTVKRDN